MRVALLLPGQIREAKDVFPFIKGKIIDKFKADVFISTWAPSNKIKQSLHADSSHLQDSLTLNDALEAFKPKSFLTEDYESEGIEKIIERASRFTEPTKQNALLASLLGGLMGLLGKGSKTTGSKGYQGAIPKYTAVRGPAASPTAGGRRPGGAGIGSLAGTTKYVPAAAGGLMGLKQGRYLDGPTDGMADQIKTDIDGKQPARLSHGEFVIPADVVSHLGNGNSDAGADVLYDMMAKVRKARTGNTKQGKQINPRKYTPA